MFFFLVGFALVIPSYGYDYYDINEVYNEFIVDCGTQENPYMRITYGGDAYAIYASDAPLVCRASEVAPAVHLLEILDYTTETNCPVVSQMAGQTPINTLDVVVQLGTVRQWDDAKKQITCNYGLGGRGMTSDTDTDQGVVNREPVWDMVGADSNNSISLYVFDVDNQVVTTAVLGSYIQLRAFLYVGPEVNYALNLTSEQSSDSSPNFAPLAVDGDPSTFSVTGATDYSPWWKVELDTEIWVSTVILTNKPGSDIRLRRFYIRVGNSDDILTNALCAEQEDSMAGGATVSFHCPMPLQGRIVSVDKIDVPDWDNFYLELAEVQVYGYPITQEETSIRVFNCRGYSDLMSYYILIGGCGEGDVMALNRGFRTRHEGQDVIRNARRVSRGSFFKSFMLPGSDSIVFECDYILCPDEFCDEYSCPNSVMLTSPGGDDRRKRQTGVSTSVEIPYYGTMPSVQTSHIKILPQSRQEQYVISSTDLIRAEGAAPASPEMRNAWDQETRPKKRETSMSMLTLGLIVGVAFLAVFVVVTLACAFIACRRSSPAHSYYDSNLDYQPPMFSQVKRPAT